MYEATWPVFSGSIAPAEVLLAAEPAAGPGLGLGGDAAGSPAGLQRRCVRVAGAGAGAGWSGLFLATGWSRSARSRRCFYSAMVADMYAAATGGASSAASGLWAARARIPGRDGGRHNFPCGHLDRDYAIYRPRRLFMGHVAAVAGGVGGGTQRTVACAAAQLATGGGPLVADHGPDHGGDDYRGDTVAGFRRADQHDAAAAGPRRRARADAHYGWPPCALDVFLLPLVPAALVAAYLDRQRAPVVHG